MHTHYVNNAPTLLTMISICLYIFFWFISHFLSIFTLITILENAHTPCKQCTNIVDNDLPLSLHFFLFFFFWFSEYIYINYHIEKHTQTMYTVPQHYQQVHIMSLLFFWFFADFLIIVALITILGSAHRPCKQYPNIITTIWIFFWFYYYFSCENAKLSIFGNF